MSSTKGPWKYDGFDSVECKGEKIILAWSKGNGNDDFKDNAKLCSAAPDLLEACKYAFKNLKPQGNIKKDFSGHNAMATLSRAIAKADGN